MAYRHNHSTTYGSCSFVENGPPLVSHDKTYYKTTNLCPVKTWISRYSIFMQDPTKTQTRLLSEPAGLIMCSGHIILL